MINRIIKKFTMLFSDVRNVWIVVSGLLLVTLSTVLLSISNAGKTYQYNVGDIAAGEIRVLHDIHFVKETETEHLRERAAQSLPVVFDRDMSVLTDRLQLVNGLFKSIEATHNQRSPIDYDDMFQVKTLKARFPQYRTYNDQMLNSLIAYEPTEELRQIISKVIINVYDNKEINIVESAYADSFHIDNKNITVRLMRNAGEPDEISGTVENLYTVADMQKKVYGICRSIAPRMPAKTFNSAVLFINGIMKPDTSFNEEETKRRLSESDGSIKPVMGILKKGQIILREGDAVTLETLERIKILNKLAVKSNITYIAGVFLTQFVFMFVLIFFLAGSKYLAIPDKNFSVIVFSIASIFMLYTFFVPKNIDIAFVFWLPLPFVTMMLSTLYNPFLSMAMSFHLVFFTSMIHGGDFNTVILSFMSALLGVFVNRNVHRRSDFLFGGLYIGIFNSVIVIALMLMQEVTLSIAFKNVQIAMASGVVNSILAIGLFPVYENLFGLTTKFKLLELSDLNSAIFRKMLIEAPGTYHHSLIVSNLAEAACRDIKADPLLARVGAYYHDIGKIENAGVYIENKVTDPSAKRMAPTDYSKLIISHVRKGVALAQKNKLPESVINFIREHHGKTTMTYFYHKALESVINVEDSQVNKSDFQYPGPKPRTKESAVVMLADAIEAASRSLQEPTPAKLSGLVRKIIYNKLNEGEFEHTDLSMVDLDVVAMSFLVILNGIYHTRIEYPETLEIERLEEGLKKKNESDT
ncbi:MAG: HDIG domain-containing protein [Leptospirales bacterium]|nr:HDIG domain-containing protein [Leptospirales bacterium]